jgi:hypothetical protein
MGVGKARGDHAALKLLLTALPDFKEMLPTVVRHDTGMVDVDIAEAFLADIKVVAALTSE